MYQNLIKNYINKMTIYNMKNFLMKEKIIINDKDLNFLYNYIKIYWKEIIINPLLKINSIKGNINNDTYNNIIILYNKYKEKLDLIK